MKKMFIKDYVLRRKFFIFELRYKLLKSISVNRSLDINIRYKAAVILDKKSIFSTKIKNYCLLTGRSRGVYSKYRISRIKLRDYILFGLLSSYKKASW